MVVVAVAHTPDHAINTLEVFPSEKTGHFCKWNEKKKYRESNVIQLVGPGE